MMMPTIGVVCEEEVSVRDKATRRKSMKQLTCRKCEGHGIAAILKGHAPFCPFNECGCETCSAVMQLRASALVRRFRHRAPAESTALLKTIRSKNGNMRLRILPKNGRTSPGGTEVIYNRRPSSRVSTLSSGSDCSVSPPVLSPMKTPELASPFSDSSSPIALNELLSLLISQSTLALQSQCHQQSFSPMLIPPSMALPLLEHSSLLQFPLLSPSFLTV